MIATGTVLDNDDPVTGQKFPVLENKFPVFDGTGNLLQYFELIEL